MKIPCPLHSDQSFVMYCQLIINHMNEKVFYAIVTVIVVVGGIGVGVAYYHAPAANVVKQKQGPYDLNLVEVMDANFGGGLGAQPRFYAVDNGSLQSVANITLPSDTQIVVTITAYDMGNASVAKQFLKPIGVVGNQIEVINGTVAMGDNVSKQWETNLSSFPASQVLHTFTILQGSTTVVNIPVMPGFTEVTSFYLNNTGSYTWQCEASCGSGSTGWGGPMSTAGWMEGSVYVE